MDPYWSKPSPSFILYNSYFSYVKYGQAGCLKSAGSLRDRLSFGRLSFVLGFTKTKKNIVNVWVFHTLSWVCFCFFYFFVFNLHCSWTWWNKGRMVTQWSEQMDPNLHGRSSWLCDCFSALCFILCLPIVFVCVAVIFFASSFCLPHINISDHTRTVCMAGTSFFSFLIVIMC